MFITHNYNVGSIFTSIIFIYMVDAYKWTYIFYLEATQIIY